MRISSSRSGKGPALLTSRRFVPLASAVEHLRLRCNDRLQTAQSQTLYKRNLSGRENDHERRGSVRCVLSCVNGPTEGVRSRSRIPTSTGARLCGRESWVSGRGILRDRERSEE